MNTLMLMPSNSSLAPPAGSKVLVRPNDWGLSSRKRALMLIRWAVRAASAARQAEKVVIVTGGLELFVLALLLRRKSLVAVDWLIPRSRSFDRFRILDRVQFFVIRTADVETLVRRFKISRRHINFVRFPAPEGPTIPATEGAYFYAAGWAHRDWETLLQAQMRCGLDIKIAANVMTSQPGVDVLGPLSPEAGRKILAASRAVVLPLLQTDLPSGPLVLLDAMAAEKAIVVSRVGGSADYVEDGVTALVVPPGDVVALAAALTSLWHDSDLRHRLSGAAKRAASEWTQEQFWATVFESPTT